MRNRFNQAFKTISRANFLPPESQPLASQDIALPIGYDQTNSQPSTVAKMLHWLDPHPGQNILDVGSGSGWTTALLAFLVGKHGRVYAVEKVPELVEFGSTNCQRVGITNANFYPAQKDYGLPQYAPYHRILVSAAASQLPTELIDQLAINGIMVIPIRQSIFVVNKTGPSIYHTVEQPGFAFVPLT